MQSIIFLAIIVISIGRTHSLTIGANQSCQQLADELNIEDPTSANSLQRACQGSNDTSSTGRARKACNIFGAVFKHRSLGVDGLAEYADPQSPFYINQTESYWYAQKLPVSLKTVIPNIRLS